MKWEVLLVCFLLVCFDCFIYAWTTFLCLCLLLSFLFLFHRFAAAFPHIKVLPAISSEMALFPSEGNIKATVEKERRPRVCFVVFIHLLFVSNPRVSLYIVYLPTLNPLYSLYSLPFASLWTYVCHLYFLLMCFLLPSTFFPCLTTFQRDTRISPLEQIWVHIRLMAPLFSTSCP